MEIGNHLSQEELEFLFKTIFYLKGSVSGRALWQLGTDTVRKVGADSLYNCWHVCVNDVSSFTFTFNQLMLGGGVGFNILPEHVYELPKVSFNPLVKRVHNNDCDFIVPDNREGWVRLLEIVLESFFYTGSRLLYSTDSVRHKGEPIKGFGGTASGPEDLVKGIDSICQILTKMYGQKLRPIDCLDILNIIATIVVAGNVRRSSQIALGSPSDFDFLDAKNWQKSSIPNWRSMSNNTVVADKFSSLPSEFWVSGYENEGEPYGILNLRNCREFGRLIDGRDPMNDPRVYGVNPCGEIPLSHKEGCNLSEIFLPNIKSVTEFKSVSEILYKSCKIISAHSFSDHETQSVVSKHHRIGVSLTGYMESPRFHDKDILNQVYYHLRQTDDDFSQKLHVEKSIKLTTIKPSGTLSLLAGVSPGMHPVLSKYIMRTVRFSADHPLVEVCREHGHRVEPKIELDGSYDHGTMVVYFPIAHSDNAVTAEEMSTVDQLEVQKHLQTYWADNSISVTHYFDYETLEDIKTWLSENYDDCVKTLSFLKRTGHGFKQAPIQPISEEEYLKESRCVIPITAAAKLQCQDYTNDDNLECQGGSCPVK